MDWLYVAQDTQAEGTVLPHHLETKPLMCHRRQAVAFYGTFVPYLESRPTIHQRYEQTPIYHLLGTSVKLVTYTSETKLHSRKTF